MPKGRAMIRAMNRSATGSGKARAAERSFGRPVEPLACERCGAVFRNRSWRRGAAAGVRHDVLARAEWGVCPACTQSAREEWFGRVVVGGPLAADATAAIRRRVRNVAARAAETQPQRRVVSVERQGDGLEILANSQKLAHRIVHELRKAFGGRATYRWSDDRSLFAVWRPRAPGGPVRVSR